VARDCVRGAFIPLVPPSLPSPRAPAELRLSSRLGSARCGCIEPWQENCSRASAGAPAPRRSLVRARCGCCLERGTCFSRRNEGRGTPGDTCYLRDALFRDSRVSFRSTEAGGSGCGLDGGTFSGEGGSEIDRAPLEHALRPIASIFISGRSPRSEKMRAERAERDLITAIFVKKCAIAARLSARRIGAPARREERHRLNNFFFILR